MNTRPPRSRLLEGASLYQPPASLTEVPSIAGAVFVVFDPTTGERILRGSFDDSMTIAEVDDRLESFGLARKP